MADDAAGAWPGRGGAGPVSGWPAWRLLFALSIALNLFLLAGAGWAIVHGPPMPDGAHDRRLERLVAEMGVDNPAELPAYQALRHEIMDGVNTMRLSNQPLFDQMWTELGKPQPDAQKLDEMIVATQGNSQTFHVQAGKSLIHFLVGLDRAKREAFCRIVADRRNPVGQPMRGWLGY